MKDLNVLNCEMNLEDFDIICRICLGTKDLQYIFDIYACEEIFKYTGININWEDGLPQKICVNCIEEINRVIAFRSKCKESESYLKEVVSVYVNTRLFSHHQFLQAEDSSEVVEQPKSTTKVDNVLEELDALFGHNKCETCGENFSSIAVHYQRNRKCFEAALAKTETEEKIDHHENGEVNTEDGKDVQSINSTSLSNDCRNVEDTIDDLNTKDIAIKKNHERSDLDNCNDNNLLDILSQDEDADVVSVDDDSVTLNKNENNCIQVGTIQNSPKNIKSGCIKCRRCNETFYRLSMWIKHIRRKHRSRPIIKCSSCEKIFLTKAHLKSHKTLCHKNRVKFLCTLCSVQFTSRQRLTVHIKKHSGVKPFVCPLCGKSTPSVAYLNDHFCSFNGIKRFACHLCPKKFPQRNHLVRHVLNVHNIEKLFQCLKCDKKFAIQRNLIKHSVVHQSKDGHFECTKCKCFFNSEDIFRVHMQKHEMDGTVLSTKDFKCHICDKSFKSNISLCVHLRLHSCQKPYRCPYCSQSFVRSKQQVRHIYGHTGIKPNACTMCCRRFLYKCTLQSHVELHAKNKLRKCAICRLSFRRKSSYLSHTKQHILSRINCKRIKMKIPSIETQITENNSTI